MSADWVRVDAQCICIDREWLPVPPSHVFLYSNCPIPVFMQTYTIKDVAPNIHHLHGGVGLKLDELYYTHPLFGVIYPWYSLRNKDGRMCWAPLEKIPDEEVVREVELT